MADPPLLGTDQFTVADALPAAAVPITGAPGAAAVPVPLTVTLCGLPVALSTMLTLADLAPIVVGANLTPTWQEPPPAIDAQPAPIVAANCPGSVPVIVTPVTFKAATPVLLTVM